MTQPLTPNPDETQHLEDQFFKEKDVLKSPQKSHEAEALTQKTHASVNEALEKISAKKIDHDPEHVIDSLQAREILPESVYTPHLIAFLRFLQKVGLSIEIEGNLIRSERNLTTINLTTENLKLFLEKGAVIRPLLSKLLTMPASAATALAGVGAAPIDPLEGVNLYEVAQGLGQTNSPDIPYNWTKIIIIIAALIGAGAIYATLKYLRKRRAGEREKVNEEKPRRRRQKLNTPDTQPEKQKSQANKITTTGATMRRINLLPGKAIDFDPSTKKYVHKPHTKNTYSLPLTGPHSISGVGVYKDSKLDDLKKTYNTKKLRKQLEKHYKDHQEYYFSGDIDEEKMKTLLEFIQEDPDLKPNTGTIRIKTTSLDQASAKVLVSKLKENDTLKLELDNITWEVATILSDLNCAKLYLKFTKAPATRDIYPIYTFGGDLELNPNPEGFLLGEPDGPKTITPLDYERSPEILRSKLEDKYNLYLTFHPNHGEDFSGFTPRLAKNLDRTLAKLSPKQLSFLKSHKRVVLTNTHRPPVFELHGNEVLISYAVMQDIDTADLLGQWINKNDTEENRMNLIKAEICELRVNSGSTYYHREEYGDFNEEIAQFLVSLGENDFISIQGYPDAIPDRKGNFVEKYLGIDTLDANTAKILATGKGERLFINTSPDRETTYIPLDIDGDTAKALATFHGKALGINTTNLTPQTAKALATFNGESLYLKHIENIDDDTAKEIAKFKGSFFCAQNVQEKIDQFKTNHDQRCRTVTSEITAKLRTLPHTKHLYLTFFTTQNEHYAETLEAEKARFSQVILGVIGRCIEGPAQNLKDIAICLANHKFKPEIREREDGPLITISSSQTTEEMTTFLEEKLTSKGYKFSQQPENTGSHHDDHNDHRDDLPENSDARCAAVTTRIGAQLQIEGITMNGITISSFSGSDSHRAEVLEENESRFTNSIRKVLKRLIRDDNEPKKPAVIVLTDERLDLTKINDDSNITLFSSQSEEEMAEYLLKKLVNLGYQFNPESSDRQSQNPQAHYTPLTNPESTDIAAEHALNYLKEKFKIPGLTIEIGDTEVYKKPEQFIANVDNIVDGIQDTLNLLEDGQSDDLKKNNLGRPFIVQISSTDKSVIDLRKDSIFMSLSQTATREAVAKDMESAFYRLKFKPRPDKIREFIQQSNSTTYSHQNEFGPFNEEAARIAATTPNQDGEYISFFTLPISFDDPIILKTLVTSTKVDNLKISRLKTTPEMTEVLKLYDGESLELDWSTITVDYSKEPHEHVLGITKEIASILAGCMCQKLILRLDDVSKDGSFQDFVEPCNEALRELAKFPGEIVSSNDPKPAERIKELKAAATRSESLEALEQEIKKEIDEIGGGHKYVHKTKYGPFDLALAQIVLNTYGMFGEVTIEGVDEISEEIAELLVAHDNNQPLKLSIKRLQPKIAEILARTKKRRLEFPRLETLDVGTTKELANYKGELLLTGLETTDQDTFAALRRFEGKIISLGITSLTPMIATSISQITKPRKLVLSNITNLDDESANILSGTACDEIELPSLTRITVGTAKALTRFRGTELLLGNDRTTADEGAIEELAKIVRIAYFKSPQITAGIRKHLEAQKQAAEAVLSAGTPPVVPPENSRSNDKLKELERKYGLVLGYDTATINEKLLLDSLGALDKKLGEIRATNPKKIEHLGVIYLYNPGIDSWSVANEPNSINVNLSHPHWQEDLKKTILSKF